ncbi:MAG: VCBS repeat-containing protein [Chitinophagaceae bacterium]|nr:VCBS repeat-containing protein [Chitinophagaceae bacterium]
MRKNFIAAVMFSFVSMIAFSQVPTISSFSPAAGPVGSSVIISGTNYNTTPSANTVYFGAVKAIVTAASTTSITATVPAGSTYLPVSVKVDSLTAFSQQPFVTTFGTGIAIRSNSFAENFTIADARLPCFGDFDNDGLVDMACIINSNRISIFKNNGTPGQFVFGTGIPYATITTPVQIVAVDFNADGKLDLAVVGTGAAVVSIYKNNSGNGSVLFENQLFYPIGSSGNEPYSIDVNDIDGDGKTDLIIGSSHSGTCFSIARNTGTGGNISFAARINFAYGSVPGGSGNVGDACKIYVADIDGDGKPDVTSLSRFFPPFLIYRNTSTPGSVSFAAKVSITSQRNTTIGNGSFDMKLGDLDGDGKPEIMYVSSDSSLLSVYRNTSVAGNISFTSKINIDGPYAPVFVAVNDMNGDGKADIAVLATYDSVFVYKNNSLPGTVITQPKIGYRTGSAKQAVALADLDADGKADFIVSGINVNSGNSNKTMVLRNIIGDTAPVSLCTSTDSMLLQADVEGLIYQWQLNTGNGFVNIADDSNYTGTASSSFVIKNIPSAWYGYQYRCVVDGVNGSVQFLTFTATWTGSFNNAWENTANWLCGQLPDDNTDVVINSPGFVIINSNVTVRSIKVKPGASVRVNAGYQLYVTH